MTSSRQSGNVLFYILICVALFAALSYAFSRGGDSGASKVSDDKARLFATEIINYGGQLREAMTRMKLRGCSDNQYDFSNDIYKTISNGRINNSNSNAPTSRSCHLFDPAGGNITPYVVSAQAVSSDTTTGWQKGHGGARIRQLSGAGTDAAAGTVSANDIILTLSFISLPVCKKINELLNVDNPGGLPPQPAESGTAGQYASGSLTSNAIITNPKLGSSAFCFTTSSGENIFLQLLLAR